MYNVTFETVEIKLRVRNHYLRRQRGLIAAYYETATSTAMRKNKRRIDKVACLCVARCRWPMMSLTRRSPPSGDDSTINNVSHPRALSHQAPHHAPAASLPHWMSSLARRLSDALRACASTATTDPVCTLIAPSMHLWRSGTRRNNVTMTLRCDLSPLSPNTPPFVLPRRLSCSGEVPQDSRLEGLEREYRGWERRGPPSDSPSWA